MQIEMNVRSGFTARDLPRAILFDMDGTPANSEDWWYQTEMEIMADLGATWPEEYVTQIVGSSLEHATSKTTVDFGLSISPQELGRELVSRVYEIGEAPRAPWRPGAYEFLSLTVDLGIPTALVTFSYERSARIAMRDAPPGFLTTVVAGDHGLSGKPDPAPYLHAAEFTGADPSSSLVTKGSILGIWSGMVTRARVVRVLCVVDVPPVPDLVKIDPLESVDETALRRFMDGERPQGDSYTDDAPSLRVT